MGCRPLVDRPRRTHRQKAKVAIVCVNGAATPRLLLLSVNKPFPNGLADSSDLVGKYLMFNSNARSVGLFLYPLNDCKGFAASRVLHDFYELDPEQVGFYRGGALDGRFDCTACCFASTGLPEQTPRWGKRFKVTPVETNSFSLDPELKDAWGLPALRMPYKDYPDDLKLVNSVSKRALEILDAAGAVNRWSRPINEQQFSLHLPGTCRMSSDRKSSVINPDHRTHDLKNLFLCDGSNLVTPAEASPP